MFDLRALKIYVDGACPRNRGGPGGFSAWVEYPFDWDKPGEPLESRGYFNTTNNRMELRACLFAHEWVLERGASIGVQHVQIATDSKYVKESSDRVPGWVQSGGLNSFGRAMENMDLWRDVLRLRRKIAGRPRIEIVKIGRCSTPIAKNVDRDAKLAVRSPTYVDDGFKPGKIGKARNNDGRAAQPYPAAGDEVIIRVYRTRAVKRGAQVIYFQTYCEQRRDFLEKYWAQADEATGNSLHRGNAFLVRMNDDAKNPRVAKIVKELQISALI
ncbi:MAG TPA: RNase H family protein [Candidatus Acidoferrales bacterium]